MWILWLKRLKWQKRRKRHMQTETEREARQAMKWILNLLARIIVSYFSWYTKHVCVLFALFRIWHSRRDGFLFLCFRQKCVQTEPKRTDSIRFVCSRGSRILSRTWINEENVVNRWKKTNTHKANVWIIRYTSKRNYPWWAQHLKQWKWWINDTI